MKQVTLRDVAEVSGFSITTVSHVLNKVPGKRIHHDTAARVERVAKELGYRPNQLAQSLRRQRSHTIGFISDQIATSPHAGKKILGAQKAAAEHDSLLLLMNTENENDLADREIRALIDRQVDGIVYAAEHHTVLTPPAVLSTVPHVLLDARTEDGGVSWVVPDEIGGVRAALTELADNGHQRIGFVQSVLPMPATDLRLQGYREFMASHTGFDPRLVAEGDTTGPGGYDAARTLLELPSELRPTALFCFNDRMAMGAYQAVADLDLQVGRDISIVGYDDQELIAANLRPGLTTIALPHEQMGCWAVETLMDSIERGENQPPRTALMPCPLVRRASVDVPPRQ